MPEMLVAPIRVIGPIGVGPVVGPVETEFDCRRRNHDWWCHNDRRSRCVNRGRFHIDTRRRNVSRRRWRDHHRRSRQGNADAEMNARLRSGHGSE